jgi:carbamate kinase
VRIVVALGGNALLRRGEPPEFSIQQTHVEAAVTALAPLAREHQLIITHGNGPQVGLLAIESTNDPTLTHPYPLDALGAQTQGMIGYWLLQALSRTDPDHSAVCVICRTRVDPDDPAFAAPTKFVGPTYGKLTAQRLARTHHWQMRADGDTWRRVVASPQPLDIVELPTIDLLLNNGVTVICSGGGGIPVTVDATGRPRGVEAVVDKDLTAALLAQHVRADVLLIMTDVEAVQDHYGTPDAQPIRHTTPAQLRARSFPAGSMGPKIEAVCRFVDATGRSAMIGRLEDAQALVAGRAGTTITPDSALRSRAVRRR